MEKYSDENKIIGIKPVKEILREKPDKIVKLLLKKTLPDHEKKFFYSSAHKKGIGILEIEGRDMDRLTGNNVAHQGVIALLSKSEPITLQALFNAALNAKLPMLVALDQIQDQGNLGAIARTAYALGCGGLLLPRHETASLAAGAWKASAGALEKIPVCITPNLATALDKAEELDFTIYGTISENDCPASLVPQNVFIKTFQLPAILILGNENRGIRPGVLKRCSEILSIPFARKFDSLNIAQAGAIIMGLFAKQLYVSR